MQQIIQSAVNFSEGRRTEIIDAVIAAVRATPGVTVLDYSHDHDHNRCVLTFAGAPRDVGEAAFRLAQKAAELINMEEHQGGHPRMGATDVIPFIPVTGVTMEDCVALAKDVGRRIGAELQIPVFLYEEAASSPARRNLADVRRGEYEGLKELIKSAERAPDFGPQKMHPRAGAVAVGARRPLVAYNINLDSSDLTVAKKIAKAIRERTGGLKNVRAIGLYLEDRNQVQVSMNLVNCDETPIYRVVELVKAEAARFGARVTDTEVVGLCPQAYLLEAVRYYLQMHTFSDDQVTENKILREMSQ
ncbi:MAG: glutamate formimidoyltransferase [Bacillota bacterium]|nr:glutamate formimidoyltransferase [Bacillota bacterium]MDW7683553.1 glutamate formimidoyltransferase [Bacillota bacterium]